MSRALVVVALVMLIGLFLGFANPPVTSPVITKDVQMNAPATTTGSAAQVGTARTDAKPPVVIGITTKSEMGAAKVEISSTQASYGVRTKTSGCTANQALPDPACSPGAVLTTDTSVICVSGYTRTVRNVSDSEKQQVFAEYGIPWSEHSNYEVDHIISLELGGSNDISNLFPESYLIQYNTHVKDTFENYLHSQVCKGNISITVAQQEISTDWLKYYLAWKGGVAAPVTSLPIPVPNITVATPTQADTSVPAYYTSSHYSSRYYYPASCSAWKSLSPSYLVSFTSLQVLLARYPDKTLSPQCP
jgi:hypothetical protein